MAQTAQLTAKPRPELGSRANKRLRDAGMLPGVIYGHKEAVVPVTLPRKEVVNHLSHGTHLFELGLDGKNETVLVKEVQYDHLGLEVLHVDFARVSLDEEVDVTVPLELKGEPKGEKDGGVRQQVEHEVEQRCNVTDSDDDRQHDSEE
jgi:large subunit ribosomal protein L25